MAESFPEFENTLTPMKTTNTNTNNGKTKLANTAFAAHIWGKKEKIEAFQWVDSREKLEMVINDNEKYLECFGRKHMHIDHVLYQEDRLEVVFEECCSDFFGLTDHIPVLVKFQHKI